MGGEASDSRIPMHTPIHDTQHRPFSLSPTWPFLCFLAPPVKSPFFEGSTTELMDVCRPSSIALHSSREAKECLATSPLSLRDPPSPHR